METLVVKLSASEDGGLDPQRPSAQPKSKVQIRVLVVIPAGDSAHSMIFARRQAESLGCCGITARTFFLASRMMPSTLMREWRRLRKEIRSFQPDIIHAQYGTITSFLCALSSSLPLVITFHGSDLNSHSDRGFLREHAATLLSQSSALRAKGIICVSKQLRSRLWWRKRSARVIPDGVNLVAFHPQPKLQMRLLLGWRHDERIVLFNAGRAPDAKGFPLVRSALPVAESLIGPIRLVMLNGATPPEEIPHYMNAADCLLMASEWEGSPNVVKEALACNLPVVAVDVGDVAERLRGVDPSRIVARHPIEFGQAIAEVLATGARSNGRNAVQSCSEEQIAQAIHAVYRAAVSRRTRQLR